MAYNHYLKYALMALKETTHNIIKEEKLEQVENTIQTCAIIAAATGVGAGMFPGGGSVVLTAASVAAIWGMYVKINKVLGISISENTLKSLASAILTNIVAGAGAYIVALAATAIISLIPGLHFLVVPAEAMIAYIAVFASGILYIKFLTKLFHAKGGFDIDNSGDDIDPLLRDVIRETDIRSVISETKNSYDQDKKDGNIKK